VKDKDYFPVVVVANKRDLDYDRQVDPRAMLGKTTNGRIYLRLRDVLGDNHSINPLVLHESTQPIFEDTRGDLMAFLGNRQDGESNDEEDADGEDDDEVLNNISTRANAATSSRAPDKGKGKSTQLGPASSPFAPATSPTPEGNKAPSALVATTARTAGTLAIGSTGPASRVPAGNTAYDQSIQAEGSNAAGARAGRQTKGKATADLGAVLAEGFANHQQMATERLLVADVRLAERDRIETEKLKLEQDRAMRESMKHAQEMEMAKIEASIAKMKRCMDLVENYDIGVETAGPMAFGGKALWDECHGPVVYLTRG
ncbi:hypothetical protein QFC20_005063, partial [Naganishia adeliensis]